MNEVIYYTEKQSYLKSYWLVLLLALDAYLIYESLSTNIETGFDFSFIVSAVVITMVSVLFLILRLETTISSKGVYVRYFPFHQKPKQFLWDDIKNASVRKYQTIFEFGGWGIRNGLSKNKTYNIYGNKGLQLELKNGTNLIIGTLKAKEIETVLSEFFNSKPKTVKQQD